MNRTFYTSIFLIFCTFVSVSFISTRGMPVVLRTNIEKLPMKIDNYSGLEDSFDQSVYDVLDADKHLYRHYRNATGDQIDLYIGYYGTAKGGRTPHNPYACLPSAGWGIEKANTINIITKNNPHGVKLNYILARQGNNYETVLHWYQSAGNKVFSNGMNQNIHRLTSRLLYNRNDGAFVRVTTLSDKENTEKAINIISRFAKLMIEILPEYWPEETDSKN